jgi:hypothetical protein
MTDDRQCSQCPLASPTRMEGCLNYVLTVVFFGTLFVSVLCVFFLFEKSRRSVVAVLSSR